MVFKRREKRSWVQSFLAFLWPRGGWGRAFHYMRHRVRRLPDRPHRIARGISAGVFAAFTPFYGLHFIIAVAIARLLNGNIWASLAGTFFGNPLTYIPIAVVSLKVGHFILGTQFDETVDQSLVDKFLGAGADLLRNSLALFTDKDADWTNLLTFQNEVLLPYMVGGIGPGIVSAVVCYYLSLPVLKAYQKHKEARLKKRLELRKKAATAAKGKTE